MAVTGTNITLVLRAEKGSILEEDELDGNQSALKNAIENHSHDDFSTEPGADGVGVSAVAINGSGNLIITLTDASVHDLGRVVGIDGDDGISITGVAINGSNHLIVTLSTGATIDAGALPSGGGTGDMLASVYDPDADGKISYNDLEDKPTLGTAAAAAAADFAAADTTAAALLAMAEEIEALSTPAGGMTNPMTAAGSIIIGGLDGTPAELPKGADGQVLTLAAGSPAWGDAPTGGASSPLIAEYIVGSGTSSGTTHFVGGGSAVSSITIGDLDGNTHGDYTVEAVFALATAGELYIIVNGDETSSNYAYYGNDFSAAWSRSADGPRLNWCYDGCRDTMEIDRLPNGKTMTTVYTGDNNTTPHLTVSAVVHNSVVSNITSIGFKPGAVGNTISVGSKFKIYRRR